MISMVTIICPATHKKILELDLTVEHLVSKLSTCIAQCISNTYNIVAGILAAMWPCGIIILICELFISESKSQVYGHLHQLFQSTQAGKNLS